MSRHSTGWSRPTSDSAATSSGECPKKQQRRPRWGQANRRLHGVGAHPPKEEAVLADGEEMTAIGSSPATSGHDLSQNGYGVVVVVVVVVTTFRKRVHVHNS